MTARAGSVVARGDAAASVLVHDVLTGPARPAVVVATGPRATYVDVDGRFLAIVAAGGVRLPCAAVLAPETRLPAAPGLAVGEGSIHERGQPVVAIGRWYDPVVRLRHVEASAVGQLGAALERRPCEDALLPADAADRLAASLTSGDTGIAVASLLGQGTGLTPAGDDLLAGALAALRAAGAPAGDRLGAAVRALAPGRTTRLSVALLEAADLGAVIPEAEAVLRALTGAGPPASPPDGLGPAIDELIGIGHTSGWHLAVGLLVGATHAGARGSAP